jgi:hypothetical protein
VRHDLAVSSDGTWVTETASGQLERKPRLLLLSMYPLDQGLWGPTVRITHLRDELAHMVGLDVIADYRGARRAQTLRYAFGGRLRGLGGIYVESASSLPAETDIAFLAMSRLLGIPVLTYFRDAYQLFPEDYPVDSPKRWLSRRAFLPAVRALAGVSSKVAAPTRGLAQVLFGEGADVVLLPPGAPPPVDLPTDAGASSLLFVGAARGAGQGAPALIEAVELARAAGTSVDLTIVCRPGEEPTGDLPPWVTIERAEGSGIHRLLPRAVATVIPRPRTPYNDLALPVKLFDYLSYGRPLIVTDCIETERVVRDAGCGLVCPATPVGLAAAIVQLWSMAPPERLQLAAAARSAASRLSWAERAREIVANLGIPRAMDLSRRSKDPPR